MEVVRVHFDRPTDRLSDGDGDCSDNVVFGVRANKFCDFVQVLVLVFSGDVEWM